MKVAYAWVCCRTGCDGGGAGINADKEAERHVKRTGHATRSWAIPVTVDPPTTDESEG